MGRDTRDSTFISINIPYEEMSKHSRRRWTWKTHSGWQQYY